VNGSGKSHLLEAINERKVVIEGLQSAQIVHFNYENFRLDNEPTLTGHQLSAEGESAWQFFQRQVRPNVSSWRSTIGQNYDPIKQKAVKEKKSLWSIGGDIIKQYQQNAKNYFKSNNLKSNHQAQGIFSLAKKTPFSIDEIEHDEFIQRYKPFTFKKDFLPVQLGKVFWDYYIKYRTNQVNIFENEKNGREYPVLTESEFIDRHGEKPWVVANRILKAFDSLTYEFVSPEGQDFFGSYKLQIKHTIKPNLYVEFDKLSSGERILMALVASIYKASSDGNFPDLLLLDEVDASLHPSMIKNMLSVIQNIFLPANVKVILVTHSPTTIALSPEESIFVMNASGLNRIQKKSQKEALSILTQGYATIDEGLKFIDEITNSNLTIITEGYNTKYISKAMNLNAIDGVEVLHGIEGTSGKNQLRTLFEFISRLQHKNKVLFVFDCDVNYSLTSTTNTFAYILPKNTENTVADSGIENLFPVNLFDGFCTTIRNSRGVETIKFDQSRKNDFLNHIVKRNNASDFENFESLLDEIRKIISSN